VVKQDGKYLMYAYLRKNFFPHDMFYNCCWLEKVIMPRGLRIDKTITDEVTQTKYCLPSNEVVIRYSRKIFKNTRYHPSVKEQRWMGKHVILTDSDADQFIEILGRLKPQQVENGFWIRKKRVGFVVAYEDGYNHDYYYIDVNNKYVEKSGRKRLFFKPSKELLSKMKEIGIK